MQGSLESEGETGLLSLPPNVLLQLWRRLRSHHSRDDQHALRCVCKGLRDMSSPWIDSIRLRAGSAAEALSQLSRFPATAVLRKLVWYFDPEQAPSKGIGSAPRPLPTLLQQASSRLASLRSLTFHAEVGMQR